MNTTEAEKPSSSNNKKSSWEIKAEEKLWILDINIFYLCCNWKVRKHRQVCLEEILGAGDTSVSPKDEIDLNTLGFSSEGNSGVWPEDGTLLKQI